MLRFTVTSPGSLLRFPCFCMSTYLFFPFPLLSKNWFVPHSLTVWNSFSHSPLAASECDYILNMIYLSILNSHFSIFSSFSVFLQEKEKKAWQQPTFPSQRQYHRRKRAWLPCSEWERVLPLHYGHQAFYTVTSKQFSQRNTTFRDFTAWETKRLL